MTARQIWFVSLLATAVFMMASTWLIIEHLYIEWRERMSEDVTEAYVARFVRPRVAPIIEEIIAGRLPSPEELKRAQVISIDLIPKTQELRAYWGERGFPYEDEPLAPPSRGMITGIKNARGIGFYYPEHRHQPTIQLRYNHSEYRPMHIAIHLVCPNPWLLDRSHPPPDGTP